MAIFRSRFCIYCDFYLTLSHLCYICLILGIKKTQSGELKGDIYSCCLLVSCVYVHVCLCSWQRHRVPGLQEPHPLLPLHSNQRKHNGYLLPWKRSLVSPWHEMAVTTEKKHYATLCCIATDKLYRVLLNI